MLLPPPLGAAPLDFVVDGDCAEARSLALVAALKFAPAAVANGADDALGAVMSSLEFLAARSESSALRESAARGAGWALSSAGRFAGVGASVAAPEVAGIGAPTTVQIPSATDFADGTTRAAFAKVATRAARILTALLGDADADVRVRAADGVRRAARYAHAQTADAAISAGILPALVRIVYGSPNTVLRAAVDSALAALLLARGPASPAEPPAALIATLEKPTVKFIQDYWQKVLRGGRGDDFSDEEEDNL